MKNIILGISMLCISMAVIAAGPPVTYQFTTGNPIVASEMNSNFQELADRIVNISNSKRKFLGFSSTQVSPSGGLKAINNACHASFNGSGICTSTEIIETSPGPTLPDSTVAIFRFEAISLGLSSGSSTSSSQIMEKGSGHETDSNHQNCKGWSDPSSAASIFGVDSELKFSSLAACNTAQLFYVACCK